MADQTTPKEENVGLYQAVCNALFVMETAEHLVITFNADTIHRWYADRIGIPLTYSAWPEVEPVLLFRIKELKDYLSKKKKPLLIRLIHEANAAWLTLKIHKALDPHCSIFQLVTTGVVDI